MKLDRLNERFIDIFGKGSARTFVAPARVNLIGEHTDHQGGYVLPCALQMRSACVVRPRTDGLLRLAASDLPGIVEAGVSDLSGYAKIPWGAYQIGVAHIMSGRGYRVCGMDMLFDETVPHGSGLSSSAAIEVATAYAIAVLSSEQSGTAVNLPELALIAQSAENDYVGMNCGIMDQFASAMGKKDHAIFLRCADLTYRYVPANWKDQGLTLIIMNTKKPRSLIKSSYNTRRAECDRAFRALSGPAGITYLAQLSPEAFEECRDLIGDSVAVRRARHVVYENDRTVRACQLLAQGDYVSFGQLMNESHDSLRDDFEVTGPELDAIVEAARACDGVLGARMTGAGFGGCAIALVPDEICGEFEERVAAVYRKKTGYTPAFYRAEISDGVREETII
ncbi:MAG: galactokinase [Clostridiaceae bacterium]|nr:galactokinase [Clostridiaceae bacterium]